MEANESLPGRREKRKQAIRRRIEDAAYELFKASGIDGVSIEQICQRADVARRTFYGHYPNKQALLQAISWRRVWFTAGDLMERVEAAADDTPGRVAAMLAVMESNLAAYSEIDRALILVAPGSLEDDNHLREVSDSLRDYVMTLVAQGQQTGDTNTAFSAELLATTVVGTTNTLIVHWAVNPDYPIGKRLEEAGRLFESMLRPR